MSLTECGRRALEQLHLAEREEEGQGRLGPLVQVDAIFLEAIATTAGLGIVDVETQVVAAEEPFERDPRLVEPGGILGRMISLEAGRYGRMRLERLLVELGPVPFVTIETIGSDRAEEAVGRLLLVYQPTQGLQADDQRRGLPPERALAIKA